MSRATFSARKCGARRTLKLSGQKSVALAFTPDQKAALLAAAKARRSKTIYPALMLALHAGMRDAEVRGLQWGRVDLERAIVTVGASKTEAGEGRTIPLNADVLAALVEHPKWYLEEVWRDAAGVVSVPLRQAATNGPGEARDVLQDSLGGAEDRGGVTGRWHDSRHTFITDLAESGEASDETIRDIAGHVSKQMLKHYSHIRMEAKRRAVNSLTVKVKTARQSRKAENFRATC